MSIEEYSKSAADDRDDLIRWIVHELKYPYEFTTDTPAPCLPLIALEWYESEGRKEPLAEYFETVYEESGAEHLFPVEAQNDSETEES